MCAPVLVACRLFARAHVEVVALDRGAGNTAPLLEAMLAAKADAADWTGRKRSGCRFGVVTHPAVHRLFLPLVAQSGQRPQNVTSASSIS
jgi:hypothetical protein